MSGQKVKYEALTYDDVLVLPAFSSVLPKDVCTDVQLTPRIRLRIPLLSSAMDTVTHAPMAIALALDGGLGVIHKNMSISSQVEEVRKVKRSKSGMILDPLYLSTDATTGEAMRLMSEYSIGGIPVVDGENRLVGIVTNRDLRFEKRTDLPIVDVMTESPITMRIEDDLDEAAELLQQHKIEKLPIVDASGHLKGLITYKDILKNQKSPHACQDTYGRLCVGAAVGIGKDSEERAIALAAADLDILCIDSAHAHSKGIMDLLKRLRAQLPEMEIMVGNVATAEAALALADLGANVVKVGIGPGSICTTRVVSGVGVPQLSAVLEVTEALRERDVSVVADGGIRFSGDIVKALVAGADAVMLGALLAGTEEAPGEVIMLQGKKYKVYRGMGSVEAMQAGSRDRYFQSHTEEIAKLVPEGVMGRIPYRGHVHEVLYQLVGGLRAGMGYCGASHSGDLFSSQFVRVTAASQRESHPHDVIITHEAPNYFS